MKYFDMSVLYHPSKAKVVEDDLCLMTMGSVSHINEAKKHLVGDVHRFSRLGVRLEDSSDGAFMIHDNPKSSFMVEMKSKQHLDKSVMEFKETVLGKLNEAFF